MDGSGAGPSRSRKRLRGNPSSPQEDQDATSHALDNAAGTQQDPALGRSRSAVKRERKRADIHSKRQGQRVAVPSPAASALTDVDDGAVAVASYQVPSPELRYAQDVEVLDEPSADPTSSGSKSRVSSLQRGRHRIEGASKDALVGAEHSNSVVQGDHRASNCQSTVPAASLFGSFGGIRAAMRERDSKAAAAAAAKVDAQSHQSTGSTRHEQEEATKRALVDAQGALTMLQRQLDEIRAECLLKDHVIESQSSALSYVYGQASCSICLELAFRPHILSPCGHTFCARCLIDWFQRPSEGEFVDILPHFTPEQRRAAEIKATKARRKICPHCRGDVRTAPAEVWSIKGMVDRLDVCHQSGLLTVEGGTLLGPFPSVEQERRLKGLDLASGSELWQDVFDDRSANEPIYDDSEGIYRCGRCTAEVVGNECVACGAFYPELEPEDYEDGSLDSQSANWFDELPDHPDAYHDDSAEEDAESMDDFIDDREVVEVGISSSEDGIEVVGPLRGRAAAEEGNRRPGLRRYGYSSDEGGQASDGENSSDADEDDAQPREATRSFNRLRPQAIMIDDSEDDWRGDIPRDWHGTGAGVSDPDEAEDTREGNVDVEDAYAADRWLSDPDHNSARQDNQEGYRQVEEEEIGGERDIPEWDNSSSEAESDSDESADEAPWSNSNSDTQEVTSDEEDSD